MADTPKRVAVIGLDCALPHLIEKHIAEGYLPTFKKLIDEGVIAENCLVTFPTVTPPNWATIATGARAGTHGITGFHFHELGTSPVNANTRQAFSSERCRAEFVWDAADKAGKKCIVLNYPGAWPSKMKNGIMVGGTGLSVGEYRDGRPGLSSRITLCADQLVTTGTYPAAIHGEFKTAEGWANVPEMGGEPLEMQVALRFPAAMEKPAETTWYVLARKAGDNGYDGVTLSPTKDFNDSFCTLAAGQWSPKITTNIEMVDGSEREVFFRCKLIELSAEAEDFRLFITALAETSGWTSPPEIAKRLVSEEGTLAPGGGVVGYALEWFDSDTYVEINEQYSRWLGDAAATLLSQGDWDMFFVHSQSPDWTYHILMTEMDPALCPDEAKRRKAWEAHLRIYQAQDQMLAQILQALDRDTLVILVSDHGATPDGSAFSPYSCLVPAGLTVLQEQQEGPQRVSAGAIMVERVIGPGARAMAQMPDVKKSKAIPQREVYVYVNLKGRDPEGIVEPEDYEKVQQEIIDALLSHVDPETGKRPVALALSKRDARILGLYGDGMGDVVYALYPSFGGQHGHILPTGWWGIGSLKGLLTMSGPGMKKGHRLQRTVWLTDLVPTICYLMDLPLPEQAEGAVIYQAFKDPNFRLKEISKLKDGLAVDGKRTGRGSSRTLGQI